MGRKSTKEDKNIYQQTREKLGLTREKASELMNSVSDDKIEKIENDVIPSPYDVFEMSKAYKSPELCNYFCHYQCEIGKEYVPEIKVTELGSTVLKMIDSLKGMEQRIDRLVHICSDGQITNDEINDFAEICKALTKVSNNARALRLWIASTASEGKIDKELLEKEFNKIFDVD